MRLRTVILGALVLAGSFAGATLLMNVLWPAAPQQARPALVAMPPLQPLTGTSVVLAPAAIALSAIARGARRQGAEKPHQQAAESGVKAARQRPAHD